MPRKVPGSLTHRQELFAENYVACGVVEQAARDAGYKAHTSGWLMMRRPAVAARVQELKAEAAKRAQLSADEVIADLRAVRDHCMQRDGAEDKYDSMGANKSLELLGKAIGMYTDKREISGELGLFDPAERARLVEELDGS